MIYQEDALSREIYLYSLNLIMKTNYSSLEALREIHLLNRANFNYTQHSYKSDK